MLPIEELVERVAAYQPHADTSLLERAYYFAEEAHSGQMRKSGDPYFVHPVRVAHTLTDLRLDLASVCAGLLHDVLEDTDATSEDLKKEFGAEIAELVDGVTKLTQINFTSKEDRQAESFRKMVVAMARDIRVLLVKLCDRMDNMRTLEHMSAAGQERIARETSEIYAPLANRLGLHEIKSELEDLSFKYINPDSYDEIVSKLSRSQRDRERYIAGVCKTLTSRLAEQGFAADVTGRAKHVRSISRKMELKNCPFEQVHDLMAFRICVESVAECYAALGVIHSKWTPVPGQFKDYVALPKPNMYQSLHTTVIGPGRQRIEIQIRTHEMHRVAEMGVAAHWRYKEKVSGGLDPSDAKKFGWLRELAEFQRNLKDPAEFVESVKIDLFPDEVYVFTPKGDLMVFPRGATVLDFAYAIHSEVGHHCHRSRANGQIVPLRYKLRSGDVVEVMTSPNQRPNKDWLDGCATSRARTRIRSYLRGELRERSGNLGRELLETEMHAAGMSVQRFLRHEDEVRRIVDAYHVGTKEELLLAIGYGKVPAEDVVRTIKKHHPTSDDAPPREFKTRPLETIVRKVRGREGSGIKVSGIDDVLVRYAKCCSPLPGDPIIGFITRGRGVTIHRRECIKAFDTDPERRIDVTWDSNLKIDRPVQLKITTSNKPGILSAVSETFSAQKININEANCRTSDDGRAHNVFSFRCADTDQLKTVMRSLRKVSGVVSVERV